MALVLVVDDVPANTQLLAAVLRHFGHDSVIASSGEEALQLMEQAHPDLVLLDLMMPGMDGFDVLNTLRQRLEEGLHAQSPPVIVVSAMGDEASQQRAAQLGAKEYLVKSQFDAEQLHELVRQYIA